MGEPLKCSLRVNLQIGQSRFNFGICKWDTVKPLKWLLFFCFNRVYLNGIVKGDILRLCLDCGAPILNRGRQARRCWECAERRERDQFKDKVKLGKIKTNYTDKCYQSFKKRAHQLQGDTCIICGWGIPDILYGGCVAHHVIGVVDGGSNGDDNMAVLCPNCHALAHHNLITEDEIGRAAARRIKEKPTLNDMRNLIDKMRGGQPNREAVF